MLLPPVSRTGHDPTGGRSIAGDMDSKLSTEEQAVALEDAIR